MTYSKQEVVGQVGPFTFVDEKRIDRIQEFWALNYAVMVQELGRTNKRFWPIRYHEFSTYLIAYEDNHLVGGARLVRPHEGDFLFYRDLLPGHTAPSAASLKALGAVGEATSLVAASRVRGRFDLAGVEHLIRQVAQNLDMTHIVVDAVIPWRANGLYAMVGYRGYAEPQFLPPLQRYEGDTRPNVLPMIRGVQPDAMMPQGARSYTLAEMEQMSAAYLEDKVA